MLLWQMTKTEACKGEALSRSDSKSNLGQNKASPAKDQH